MFTEKTLRNGLYHITIFYPFKNRFLPHNVYDIKYCPHALEMAREREILLPHNIYRCAIPEVQIKNGLVVKALYKTEYSRNQNLCLVFHIVDDMPYMVRTVWINHKEHKITVNENRYIHAQE